MDREMAIRILDRDSTREAIAEIEYFAGFNREKVIDAIEEAMQMGADALREKEQNNE